MNTEPDKQANPTAKTVNNQQAELLSQTSHFISRWSGPFVSFLSYGIILGLGLTGIGLMTVSAMIGLFFDSGRASGFGFLTGGVFLAVGCTMILWKLTRALGLLYQIRQQAKTA